MAIKRVLDRSWLPVFPGSICPSGVAIAPGGARDLDWGGVRSPHPAVHCYVEGPGRRWL